LLIHFNAYYIIFGSSIYIFNLNIFHAYYGLSIISFFFSSSIYFWSNYDLSKYFFHSQYVLYLFLAHLFYFSILNALYAHLLNLQIFILLNLNPLLRPVPILHIKSCCYVQFKDHIINSTIVVNLSFFFYLIFHRCGQFIYLFYLIFLCYSTFN